LNERSIYCFVTIFRARFDQLVKIATIVATILLDSFVICKNRMLIRLFNFLNICARSSKIVRFNKIEKKNINREDLDKKVEIDNANIREMCKVFAFFS